MFFRKMLDEYRSLMFQAPQLDWGVTTSTRKPHYALLINPFYPKDPHVSFGKHVLTPTLALTSLAGATLEHWEVSYWDENLLQGHPPYDPFPSVVGITVHLTFAKRAYELSRWYREHGAVVVLGGLHALSCPEEVEAHADAIALGEGVQLWPQILRDFEAGQLRKRYVGRYKQPYKDDPAPRRAILPRQSFLTATSVNATRGCHNRCGFCYLSTEGLHIPYQMRDPKQIAAEIVENKEPYVVFTDNNLGSKKDYLKQLCRTLREIDIIWSAAVTIDVTDDPTLVKEMALSGCTGVFVGLESLSGSNLDDSKKKTPRPEDYARRVKLFHDYGIQVNASFVFGFDHDGPDVFQRTVSWIEENKLACATFHILTPYPGTPLFRQMETQGRLLHQNWDLYDTSHVVFRPKSMTPEQLQAGYEWSYQRLFSLKSIFRRIPERITEVIPFLMMTYLYKKLNRYWPIFIRHQLTHKLWKPLVYGSLKRHKLFRKRLSRDLKRSILVPLVPITPSV